MNATGTERQAPEAQFTTAAERTVISGLARGRAPKQLAIEYGVSLPTIRAYIQNAKRKTRASTLTELVAIDPPREPVASRASVHRLTARQREVVALLAAGLRYGEVAERLSISTRQVQRLAAQAVERAGVVNVCQLVASAVEAQLI